MSKVNDLRKLLALNKSIDEHRHDMYEFAKEKSLSDPQIIKISQQLDREIIIWQKSVLVQKTGHNCD
ncbi:aspartyl-phosphate phosphatase Spo0E family protein [Bacillus sp. GB_SG_008]|uniref:aspartyl-phosphate phosphatase Spo0E family protein n=1 Tax=Bacillus sp. GB_SG_008 TaxID=3454627 RepID=UPI003F8401A1